LEDFAFRNRTHFDSCFDGSIDGLGFEPSRIGFLNQFNSMPIRFRLAILLLLSNSASTMIAVDLVRQSDEQFATA
jgi:hypothetical protein